MRALVKYARGPGLTELRDVPVPQPGPGEVRVKVKAAAVCASDVHILHDRFPYEPPLVLGHEYAGTVDETGAGVDNVEPGLAVVSENNPLACGTCRVCSKGFPNLCPQKRAIGFKSDGCFAEYLCLPASLLHRVPEGVSFRAASLSEPLAVAVHAVADRCGIERGDCVVVLGPGAIGLLAAQVARAEGAGRVLVAGMDRDEALRLSCARSLGFEAVNLEHENLEERVLAVTDGVGADVVVEAAGVRPAVNTGIRLLRRAGRMVALGITGQPEIALHWDGLVSKGASVVFSFSSRPRNWAQAMQLLGDGRVDAEALVTETLALENWQRAFERMQQQDGIRYVFDLERS